MTAWRTLDITSMLVEVEAATTLVDLEHDLREKRLTLDIKHAERAGTVGSWLEAGAPGARDTFRDPVDHLVAGIDATLRDGTSISVRPGPRRAVGPDLVALFVGCRGRFGSVTRAWLRVHHEGVQRPETAPFARLDPDPALTDSESKLLDAIERELAIRSR
jgi:alkyldihydroxyacetonephosphate synthase